MKTKIKLLTILIATFAVTLIAGLFAGCIGEITAEEQARKMGYTCSVTYYTNGGNFKEGQDTDQKSYKTVFYKPEKPIFNILENSKPITIARTNYKFLGWEYCVLDENDKPVLTDYYGEPLKYLDNGSVDIPKANGAQVNEDEKKFIAKTTGEKVFANGNITLKKNQKLFIAAKWEKLEVLQFKLVTDVPMPKESVTTKGEYGQDIHPDHDLVTGDICYEQGYDTSGRVLVRPDRFTSSWLSFSDDNPFSYIHLYRDQACTDLIPTGETTIINKPADGAPAPVVYVKYLKGKWTPVRTSTEFSGIFTANAPDNYFLVNDIDCTGNTNFTLRQSSYTFNHVIVGYGENCTVTNIQYGATGLYGQQLSATSGTADFSIFGTLGAQAKIKDVTFKDIKIKAQASRGNMNIYLLMGAIAQGATLENFAIDGIELTLTVNEASANVLNLMDHENGYTRRDNWLYGGFNTDADFVSAHGEVVKNYELII